MSHDEHLEIAAVLPEEKHVCEYCHAEEDQDFLFLHAPTQHRLCQKCLGVYLQGDIGDSEDHKARFENYVFQRGPFVGYYEAVSDDDGQCTLPSKDIHDVVESVLMSKNYI